MIWSDYRTQIRRSVLFDNPTDASKRKWSDDVLRDYLWWALDAFCAHTAVATATGYDCDGVLTEFTLPGNVYAKVDTAGLVFTNDADSFQYLTPVYYTPGWNIKTEYGFYTWPDGTLKTVIAPNSGLTLNVRYYAYYNHPYADTDDITLPSWAYGAVAHLVASYAMTNYGNMEARISQHDSKQDAGNPTQLALKSQADWLFKVYETELARHPKQDRRYGPLDKR